MRNFLRRATDWLAVCIAIMLVLAMLICVYSLVDPQNSLYRSFLLALKQDSRLPALQQHRQQWTISQPHHYRYTLEQHGMIVDIYPSPNSLPDRLVIEVSEGQILNVNALRKHFWNEKPEDPILEEARSFDWLFEFAQESIYRSSYPDEVQIAYNEQFGYISKLRVDYRNSLDEQRSFEITSFEVLP